jgi:hypothetical protein
MTNKKSRPKQLVAPTQPTQSPIQDCLDLLDHLQLKVCMELTHRLFTSVTILLAGSARSRAVLKIVIFFIDKYGSTT